MGLFGGLIGGLLGGGSKSEAQSTSSTQSNVEVTVQNVIDTAVIGQAVGDFGKSLSEALLSTSAQQAASDQAALVLKAAEIENQIDVGEKQTAVAYLQTVNLDKAAKIAALLGSVYLIITFIKKGK